MICKICGVPEGEGQCRDCRDLADEIRINSAVLAALRDETILPLAAARNLRRKPAFWWGAAAAAVLIALALPLTQYRPTGAPIRDRHDVRDTSEPLKVKVLTPDPDVVIYWLIDSKENVPQ
jgi:hypothetical protein